MKIPISSMEIVLITGMSGSGKSVALHALEDSGYYCVDNLPPELLLDFVELERQHAAERIAIAMDVRSATSLPILPQRLASLREKKVRLKLFFLDASTGTLVKRYSETRRRHPLSKTDIDSGNEQHALIEAIEQERTLLADLRNESHVLDTSNIRSSQLQSYVKDLITPPAAVNGKNTSLTLVFESFGFKRGIPRDADYVFDVRMLPNPHYEPLLRDLTGRDAPVIDYLRQYPDVEKMYEDIAQFAHHWLPALVENHRSYVTIAVGCTGGQHRSVYLAERLTKAFSEEWISLVRHRELDAKIK